MLKGRRQSITHSATFSLMMPLFLCLTVFRTSASAVLPQESGSVSCFCLLVDFSAAAAFLCLNLAFSIMPPKPTHSKANEPGHKSPECRNSKDIERKDWAINKSQSHAQAGGDISGSLSPPPSVVSEGTVPTPEPQVGWAGVHCSFAQPANLKDLILLDSDSTDTVFCNPDYVLNIRDTKETLQVLTNGGLMKSQQKCDIPHLGECWFNRDSITNIIVMCDMRNKFRITMDTRKEAALLVHMGDKAVKFKEWPNGLYAMNPSDPESFGTLSEQYQMIQSRKT